MSGAQDPALWPDSGDAEVTALHTWHRYHLIGDVLRATAETPFVCSETALSAEQSRSAVRRILAQAQSAPTEPVNPVVQALPPRPTAANDAVFRWKMVSGFASVVAVVSLAWGLGGPTAGPSGSAELAQSAPATPVVVASTTPVPPRAPASEAVLVSTPHGQVLRDARLEELMQAHRQAGGANALQVPAGFLRNATFDATQR
jgi:sigma-E factor negative regulatory protein RseA